MNLYSFATGRTPADLEKRVRSLITPDYQPIGNIMVRGDGMLMQTMSGIVTPTPPEFWTITEPATIGFSAGEYDVPETSNAVQGFNTMTGGANQDIGTFDYGDLGAAKWGLVTQMVSGTPAMTFFTVQSGEGIPAAISAWDGATIVVRDNSTTTLGTAVLSTTAGGDGVILSAMFETPFAMPVADGYSISLLPVTP